MQIVENLEEGILGTLLLGEFVDVVNNEHVNRLIVPQEVNEIVVQADSVHKLGLETVCADIEDYLVGILLLDGDADGMRQVGFAKAGTAIDEKRIEGSLAGLVGNAQTGRTTEPVAFPFYEIIKCVCGIEVRIYPDLLEAGDKIGIAVVLQRISG